MLDSTFLTETTRHTVSVHVIHSYLFTNIYSHCAGITHSTYHSYTLSHHTGACLDRLRQALALRPGVHVGVMLDTKGPEIRTGTLDASLGGKLPLKKGQTIEVGTDYARPGTTAYLRMFRRIAPAMHDC